MLNEGKTFTPVFVLSVFLIDRFFQVEWGAFLGATLLALPLFAVYYAHDYPLHLRWFLWGPLFAFGFLFSGWNVNGLNVGLFLWAFGLYAFFTVFFWGTLYYHLRIGTTWWNFTRIWKLFLKNTDSTSGNVFEQLPKVFLQLLVMDWGYRLIVDRPFANGQTSSAGGNIGFLPEYLSEYLSGPLSVYLPAHQAAYLSATAAYLGFVAAVALYGGLIHKRLFNWKPAEYATYTRERLQESQAAVRTGDMSQLQPPAKRVVVIVIDGCRKERFEQADTPFLSWMRNTGVYYNRMETVYPARTVVCFSSMFTGTYPSEHGIKSNMVWKLGVRVESIFDTLKAQGRKGIMYACAHLIDAFGGDVQSYSAVADNNEVDRRIMEEAKRIMKRDEPDLMVIQMIAVDQTGHSRGVWYPEYLEKIKESDALIHEFYHWMEQERLRDDTVFIVMADHGQGDGIGGHGHLDEGERFVPFLMHGPGIRQGITVEEPRSIVSLAPTIAHLLGAPIPNRSRGPILSEAMAEIEDEYMQGYEGVAR